MTTEHNRRNVLRAAVAGGAGLTLGAAVGGTAAAMASDQGVSQHSLVVEVACLGQTSRSVAPPLLASLVPEFEDLDQADLRGAQWWVEGWIYPAGTIAGDGFLPTEDGRIGAWFCRGHNLASAQRPDPHLATVHEYYFGEMDTDPLGQETLLSQGIEGRNAPEWEGLRAITGGTGKYRAARGQVLQRHISQNSTEFPWGGNAPNFSFEFDLDLP